MGFDRKPARVGGGWGAGRERKKNRKTYFLASQGIFNTPLFHVVLTPGAGDWLSQHQDESIISVGVRAAEHFRDPLAGHMTRNVIGSCLCSYQPVTIIFLSITGNDSSWRPESIISFHSLLIFFVGVEVMSARETSEFAG